MPEPGGTPLEELRSRIRERSPLSAERTEWVVANRYDVIPNRLAFALARWPLARSAVLDVGCSFGHCLAQFGPGSLGIDNVEDHVGFCRAIGLHALQADVDVEHELAAIPDASFDFIWLCDLLEHLDSPRLVLRRLAPKLRPDGTLLLYLGALPRSRVVRAACRRAGVVPFEPDVHYYQFTLETARYVVERAGYRVDAIEAPGLRGRLRTLARLALPQSPTLILAASPDPERRRAIEEAERRNKPEAELKPVAR
jgi:SAM-dependent methyltransferase